MWAVYLWVFLLIAFMLETTHVQSAHEIERIYEARDPMCIVYSFDLMRFHVMPFSINTSYRSVCKGFCGEFPHLSAFEYRPSRNSTKGSTNQGVWNGATVADCPQVPFDATRSVLVYQLPASHLLEGSLV